MKTTKQDEMVLTSAEIGKLWAAYMGNSMSEKVLLYFLQHVEDPEIRIVVERSLTLCQDFIIRIEGIYRTVSHPVPIGFTHPDMLYFMLFPGLHIRKKFGNCSNVAWRLQQRRLKPIRII